MSTRPARAGAGWRRLRWAAAIVLGVLVVAGVLVATILDEPLRQHLERRLNAQLEGYTVTIGELDLHLSGFSVELEDVTVVQDARPAPPVVYLPRWTTSVEWRALLSLAIVADTVFERPEIFLTEDQAAAEARDRVPVEDRGWQDAVMAVYPLEINALRVVGGTITYRSASAELPPLRLERVFLEASNIRNVRSAAGKHPSPIEIECALFERGTLQARGRADFLAEPRPTFETEITLRDLPLEPLAPIARTLGMALGAGAVAAEGTIAQEAKLTRIALREVVVSNPDVEYGGIAAPAPRVAPEVEEAAADAGESVVVEVAELRIADGSLKYRRAGDVPPITLDGLNLRITSLGNVPPPRGRLPSRVELDCRLLDGATLRARGRANLLARPLPVGTIDFDVDGVELTRLTPLVRPSGLAITSGTLRVNGRLAREPGQTRLVVRRLAAAHPTVEFVQRTPRDEQRVQRAAEETATAEQRPAVRVDLEQAAVSDGTFTFTDETATPPYRLFLADTDITLAGFSNQRSERAGVAWVGGRFMGSGQTTLDARFASGGAGRPEFELSASLQEVDLTTLNDLLRARGGFDVVAGRFSFFTELAVKNGRVEGYVKPFFKDMDVYDRAQEAGKGVGKQVYEALVGGAATVLENRPRDQVATRAELSGPIKDPDASTWQIVIGLLQNAFWSGLRPGLEGEPAR